MSDLQVRILCGERPATVPAGSRFYQTCQLDEGDAIPADWVLMTAPRPLFGHIEWRDGGGYGFFWVVVDPTSEEGAWMTERNRRDAAEVVVYMSEAELVESQRAYYHEHLKNMSAEEIDEYCDNAAKSNGLAQSAVRRLNSDRH